MSAIQQTSSNPVTAPASDGSAAKTAVPATDPLTSKTTFLQLLVAQLKNQDPLTPMDGTQFVTQLAQFSSLEQSMTARQDLDAIRQVLEARLPATVPAQSNRT